MDKPTIEINGNVIELPPIKARVWREIIKFDSERETLLLSDYVDRHCEIIALMFGITKDDVLDNIEISNIIPTYTNLIKYLLALLFNKTQDTKKNEEVNVEVQT